MTRETPPWLTPRELEVAQHVADGLSNKMIAAAMTLSEKTVKNHFTKMFVKLDIQNRAQLSVFVCKNGLSTSKAAKTEVPTDYWFHEALATINAVSRLIEDFEMRYASRRALK